MQLPFKRTQPALTKQQFRTAKVHRNPGIEWEDQGDKVVLSIPRRKTGFWAWLGGFAKLPDVHRVEFETVGATVWRLCDGRTTVEGIITELCQTYKMSRVEAEMSLRSFLDTLARRRYIVLTIKKK